MADQKDLPQISPDNKQDFYQQEWSESQKFAGLEFTKEYGNSINNNAEYSYIKNVGAKRLLMYLDFDSSPFRQEDGIDVLKVPGSVRLDFKVGEGTDQINPPVLAIRFSDKGSDEIEIFFMTAPFDKHGLIYELYASNGLITEVLVDEFERPNESNRWNTVSVEKPTMFIDEYENSQFTTSILDDETIKQLEQLELPTTWTRGQKSNKNGLVGREIAPFSELLKRFEDLASKLGNNAQINTTPLLD